MKKELPVLLLTGYLGSGKTTLLNRILANSEGIKYAVIVNDIGEVNIDASLIQKGGVVGQDPKSPASDLVALQNGCICCTLADDLMAQIQGLVDAQRFDYIVIEASGICEPAPIAQTICAMNRMDSPSGIVPVLDNIVTVVDALRLRSEFRCGEALAEAAPEDIENLIIEQIEFCNTILINKISDVTHDQAAIIKATVRAIQPKADIIECDYCDVPLNKLIGTRRFDFEKTATSATWVDKIENHHEHEHEHDHHHDHDHHHHDGECCHCHNHGEGEALEYGISTFVYYRRKGFDINKFDYFITSRWPKTVIRAKGILYFTHNDDICYVFEQAGEQKKLSQAGLWYATAPDEELERLMAADPTIKRDWDERYGDRMVKLVFIGRDMDQAAIIDALDDC